MHKLAEVQHKIPDAYRVRVRPEPELCVIQSLHAEPDTLLPFAQTAYGFGPDQFIHGGHGVNLARRNRSNEERRPRRTAARG